MNNKIIDTSDDISSLSWPAIIAGIMVSLGIGALMSLIGVGVGGALIKSGASNGIPGFGSLLWIIIGGVISLGIGGIFTGYFASTLCKITAALEGLIMWSLSLLFGLILVAAGAGVLVTGAGQLVGSTLKIVGKSIDYVVPDATQLAQWAGKIQDKQLKSIGDQVKKLINPNSQNDQASQNNNANSSNNMSEILMSASGAQDNLLQAIKDYLSNNNEENSDSLHQAVVTALTQNTSLNSSQAEEVVNAWKARYKKITEQANEQAQQLKEKAIETAKNISGQLSKAAWLSFFVLLLGAVAAGLGGAIGTAIRSRRYNQ